MENFGEASEPIGLILGQVDPDQAKAFWKELAGGTSIRNAIAKVEEEEKNS